MSLLKYLPNQDGFYKKITLLKELKDEMQIQDHPANKLIYECLYWGMSVLENEGIPIERIKDERIQKQLVDFFTSNIKVFYVESSHFYKNIQDRYNITSNFFSEVFQVDLSNYIKNTGQLKVINERIYKNVESLNALSELESLRLNKPDASTTTIEDICRSMARQRFLVRPVYQRNEAINKVKSSAIIESILLGIKLPPIFVYKRPDGVSEVVDGQQRLLSILGYIGAAFLDEAGSEAKSEKNHFSLTKLNIIKELNGKRFLDLPPELQDKILEFNISVVNIDAKLNPSFDPIDLFIRLNNKPYPIREDTFELWNSYIDREIIEIIKENWKKYDGWFYSRVNNKRMENEELYTNLAYLEYKAMLKTPNKMQLHGILDMYQTINKINGRIKRKGDITKILNMLSTNDEVKETFKKAIKNVEKLIGKTKTILLNQDIDQKGNLECYLKGELDALFGQKKHAPTRAFQTFYALWYILLGINTEMINFHRSKIRSEVSSLLRFMKNIENEDRAGSAVISFQAKIQEFKEKYSSASRKISLSDEERKIIIKKQENKCPLCTSDIYFGDDLEVDHIVPIGIGGRDGYLNMQVVHKNCNRKKRVGNTT